MALRCAAAELPTAFAFAAAPNTFPAALGLMSSAVLTASSSSELASAAAQNSPLLGLWSAAPATCWVVFAVTGTPNKPPLGFTGAGAANRVLDAAAVGLSAATSVAAANKPLLAGAEEFAAGASASSLGLSGRARGGQVFATVFVGTAAFGAAAASLPSAGAGARAWAGSAAVVAASACSRCSRRRSRTSSSCSLRSRAVLLAFSCSSTMAWSCGASPAPRLKSADSMAARTSVKQ
mmetsp:Transcript_81590/g.234443  ORF Transcript_81590/g.234443 Transcript_81590/m.234443 type:complete len:236 (-) Transcript_81590:39-746(-)